MIHKKLELIFDLSPKSLKFAPRYSGAMETAADLGGTKEKSVQLARVKVQLARVKDRQKLGERSGDHLAPTGLL